MMKFLKIACAVYLLSICQAQAASITVKAYETPSATEDGIHLKTNKGHIAIYAVNLSEKQLKSLGAIKKNDCVLITAKDESLASSDGVISVSDFTSATKVACK